jgi:putative effector of murein hydrolase
MKIDLNFNFVILLTILFFVLKVMGYIHWSWWWVLCPLWIVPVIILFVLGTVIIYGKTK